MTKRDLCRTILVLILCPIAVIAQVQRDVAPLTPWSAPLYWQPTPKNAAIAAGMPATFGDAANAVGPNAATPIGSLVFVGMTPCRIADTRTGSGFTGAFGPPIMAGGATRTFPIQSSTTCTIPAIAQAYSFNITIVPPGFVNFIIVWPTGQPRPNASTLNGFVSTVIANAAIVPAGTSGSVNVFTSENTNIIIDINGYYAPQTGITLAQATAGAPSLSFTNDPGTGIFSSGANTVSIATAGTSRLTVRSDGDLDLTGNIRKEGTLFLHSLGNSNTGLGLSALSTNTTGNWNTASGAFALFSNTNGGYNTATGVQALFSNTAGVANTATGVQALFSNTGGGANTASGYYALLSNTTGGYNTATGAAALRANTAGESNTASGVDALSSNTTGGANTATGRLALGFNTTGSLNTASGIQALTSNTTGSYNTASGYEALGLNTTGRYNTGSGVDALFYNTAGSYNTAIGDEAGRGIDYSTANTTGSVNTFIGYAAGPGTSTQLINATAIGANALVSASNALVLGDSSVSVGIGTQAPSTKLQVVGDIRIGTSGNNGCLQSFGGAPIAGTCSSDMRLKQNIEPFAPVLDKVVQLQPVSYEWNADEHPEYHFGSDRTSGLIAQHVEKVFPTMVSTDEHGYKAVNYSQVPLLLLQAMREQQEVIQLLRSEVEELKALVRREAK